MNHKLRIVLLFFFLLLTMRGISQNLYVTCAAMPSAQVGINGDKVGELDKDGFLKVEVKNKWRKKECLLVVVPKHGFPILKNIFIRGQVDTWAELVPVMVKIQNLPSNVEMIGIKYPQINRTVFSFYRSFPIDSTNVHYFLCLPGDLEMCVKKSDNKIVNIPKQEIPEGVSSIELNIGSQLSKATDEWSDPFNSVESEASKSNTSSSAGNDWDNNNFWDDGGEFADSNFNQPSTSGVSPKKSGGNNEFGPARGGRRNRRSTRGSNSSVLAIYILGVFIGASMLVGLFVVLIKRKKKEVYVSSSNDRQSTSGGLENVRIDKYQLLNEISSGGYGEVWKCRNVETGAIVAMKLARTDKDKELTTTMFVNEVKVLETLFHNNVVRIFEAGFSYGRPYIVMEFIDGISVREAINRRAPFLSKIDSILRIIVHTARALNYLHHLPNKIIHQDLKPENILLTVDSKLKGFKRLVVIDYGISGDSIQRKFTPSYMSPEHLNQSEICEASDIFSLGAILYELMAWEKLFEGEDDSEVIQKVMSFSPDFVNFPEDLNDIVGILVRMTHPDLSKRYSDTTLLLTDLTKICYRRGIVLD